MADGISLNIGSICTNGSFKTTFQPGTVQITQAAQGAHCPIVSVSTAEENLTTGDIGTLGVICLRNLDATNYVIAGPTTASTGPMRAFIRIKAGEPAAFRLEPGITWRWKAVGGTVKVDVRLFEA